MAISRAYGGEGTGVYVHPMPSPIVEIAVDNLTDALAAFHAGADRLELCDALSTQGLSASPRVLADLRVVSTIPVAAMIRPRMCEFVSSPSDNVLAPRQAEQLLAAGADGIVFGFLTPERKIDVDLCERLVTVAGAAQTVFHRAFDLVADRAEAMEQLIDLGVSRILTAGMSPPTATHSLGLPSQPYTPDSLDARLLTMRRDIDRAAGRIEILPCGGVRSVNAQRFVNETGATQLHSACRPPGADHLDTAQVRELIAAVRSAKSA